MYRDLPADLLARTKEAMQRAGTARKACRATQAPLPGRTRVKHVVGSSSPRAIMLAGCPPTTRSTRRAVFLAVCATLYPCRARSLCGMDVQGYVPAAVQKPILQTYGGVAVASAVIFFFVARFRVCVRSPQGQGRLREPSMPAGRGLFAACVDGPSSGTRGPGLGVGLARFREALDSSSVTVLMRLVQLKIRLRVPSTWVRHLTTTVTITVMTKVPS